jgi:hypothetical protein
MPLPQNAPQESAGRILFQGERTVVIAFVGSHAPCSLCLLNISRATSLSGTPMAELTCKSTYNPWRFSIGACRPKHRLASRPTIQSTSRPVEVLVTDPAFVPHQPPTCPKNILATSCCISRCWFLLKLELSNIFVPFYSVSYPNFGIQHFIFWKLRQIRPNG